MLENALAAGVMSLGADVLLIGPLPTYQAWPILPAHFARMQASC
jgi:phosphomannomutase